jgi:Family of unknown function (DUF6221)
VNELLDFLNIRIAEDEAEAANWAGPPSLRARQRREVEAKRALITFALENAASIDGEWGDCHEAAEIASGQCKDYGIAAAEQVLKPLAAIWRDHPEYQESWKS